MSDGFWDLEAIWYMCLNTCFQFLNNITRISTHFFHPDVFSKNTNNVTRTTLPNGFLELGMNRYDGLGKGSSRFLCFFGNFGGGINLSWVCS